ncbi:MAG: GMC family oxidoreductase [Gemmatimonadetes bacterium]|nr:GMC family oxidoreductase [Gemmatimonadota bacterium]
MTRRIESDVCIIGSGITAILTAQRLTELADATIVMVEAGGWTTPFRERLQRRRRMIEYGENPWIDDHIEDQTGEGLMYRSMVVGGCAMHWDGATPRFSPEDFRQRSLYGVGTDWPIAYDDLEPYYADFERRIGVAGEPGPQEYDPRSGPYPMPPLPLSYNLARLKEWGESADIPFWTQPWAKATTEDHGRAICRRCDTCHVCPTGAKYTPDVTLRALIDAGRLDLHTHTLVRRLELAEDGETIEHAVAVDRNAPEEPVEFRASTFILAAGYAWSPHLLLLSANGRFPDGLANRSGLVGKYMTGHPYMDAYVDLPLELYPGMFATNSLLSRKHASPGPLDRYVRHDLRIWEATSRRGPRLRDETGRVLFGDEVLADWRARSKRAVARLRSYYDVVPDRESSLTLDPSARNRWGDPLPKIAFRDAEESIALRDHTHASIGAVFERMARAGDGSLLSTSVSYTMEHPGGGCRMGDDPSTSVTDSYGRTHDHENLFVIGAPTLVSGGCANGTPTFSALSLRSAEEIARGFSARR